MEKKDMDKEYILENIMKINLSNWELEGVINIGLLGRILRCTTDEIRPYLVELEKEGYIEKGVRSGGWCDYTYMPYPPVKGYCITEKAKGMKMYKRFEKEFEERLKKAFDIV